MPKERVGDPLELTTAEHPPRSDSPEYKASRKTLMDEYGGGCFICARPPREDISLHVDHDHSTGKVRGILCFRCNNALADFQEDVRLLAKAADYLDRHRPATKEEIDLVRERARSLVRG